MSGSERIRLNVGGVRFETTLTTIRRIPDSMLAVMFSGQHTVNKDDDGFVFIDRSPTHFDGILNFLRTGTVPVGMPHQGLEAELEYYGLHQAFLDAGGQEILDPDMTSDTTEYLLLSISVSHVTDSLDVAIAVTDSLAATGRTLAKLEQMLDADGAGLGLRWEQNSSTLVGACRLSAVSSLLDRTYAQAQVDELMIYLFQLISNGDFGNDFGFKLISSSSSGSMAIAGGNFVNQSVFRRLQPWYKHANVPSTKVPRKRNADEMAAGSRGD